MPIVTQVFLARIARLALRVRHVDGREQPREHVDDRLDERVDDDGDDLDSYSVIGESVTHLLRAVQIRVQRLEPRRQAPDVAERDARERQTPVDRARDRADRRQNAVAGELAALEVLQRGDWCKPGSNKYTMRTHPFMSAIGTRGHTDSARSTKDDKEHGLVRRMKDLHLDDSVHGAIDTHMSEVCGVSVERATKLCKISVRLHARRSSASTARAAVSACDLYRPLLHSTPSANSH